MADLEANKKIAWKWAESSVAGDLPAVRDLFAADCRFMIVGDMPYSGWMGVDEFFTQTTILPLGSPIQFDVGEMIAEGDRVWFEAESEAKLLDGSDYHNYYVFQFRILNSKISEYKEFCDTLHIYRTIDHPLTRGQAIERQPFLSGRKRRLTGSAVGEAQRKLSPG